jgi:membrane protease YdiL (CAAX protease family)
MRKDITIAKVRWGVRDVVEIIVATTVIPLAIFSGLVLLSRVGILPQGIRNIIRTNDLVVYLGFEIVLLAVEVIMLARLMRKYKLNVADLGFRKFPFFRSTLYVVIGIFSFAALMAVVLTIVAFLLPFINTTQSQDSALIFGNKGPGLALGFVLTVVIAPIVEELYFRGLVLPAFTKKYGWIAGVLISSGAFAILHLQPNVIIYTFVLGLVLSFFYIRLKSIIPGIIFHMINNFVAFSVLAGLIK